MLDAISGGRAEIGFAQAFLPHEYDRFGICLTKASRVSTGAWNRSNFC